MTFKYSKTTGGFYLPEFHGNRIPADAVDVSAAEHEALMIAQSHGAVIQPGPDGRPFAAIPAGA